MILEKRKEIGAVKINMITIGIKLCNKLSLKSKVEIAKVIIEIPTVSP